MSVPSPQSGFTLVELLVALSITALILLMTTSVFTQGVRHARIIGGEAKLLNAASHLTDVLAYNIRPGVSATTPAADTLSINAEGGAVHIITKAGDNITIDGTPILPPQIVANSLSFIIIGDTIQISFSLGSTIPPVASYSIQPFVATTAFTLRNSN